MDTSLNFSRRQLFSASASAITGLLVGCRTLEAGSIERARLFLDYDEAGLDALS